MVKPSLLLAEETAPSREQLIKAAFLYNFTKFVDWPPRSFSGGRDPICIGVLGHSPSAAALAGALEQTVAGRSVNGRGVVVKRVDGAGEASAVHMLFVPAPDEVRFAEMKPAFAHSAILTVGESPSFLRAGGVINFVVEDDKIRFEINAAAAERAGLRISAQLRKLARPARIDISATQSISRSNHAPV